MQPLIKEFVEPLKLSFPYPPGINSYWTLARGHIIVSAKGKDYRKIVKYSVSRDLYYGPLSLRIELYRPRKAGDIDGPLKCLLDAMQGVIYENDSQVVELHVIRFDDKSNPRVEITIMPGYMEETHAILSRQ